MPSLTTLNDGSKESATLFRYAATKGLALDRMFFDPVTFRLMITDKEAGSSLLARFSEPQTGNLSTARPASPQEAEDFVRRRLGWRFGAPELLRLRADLQERGFRKPNSIADSILAQQRLTPAGAAFIKSWERGPLKKGEAAGPALKPYGAGEGGSDTIGWGHKIKAGEDFSAGISPAEADKIFDADVADAVGRVNKNIKVPLTSQEFDALVSLEFNSYGATRLTKLADALNRGDYDVAARRIYLFNKSRDVVNAGLVRRRASEVEVFVNGIYKGNE